MKMVNYLRDTGSDLRLGEVAAPKTDFADHVEPIRLALEHERKVTVAISAIFEIARETNDYASESFMQWFVDEQVEEESTMEALLQVAERVREYPMMLEEFLARDGDELGAPTSRLAALQACGAAAARTCAGWAARHGGAPAAAPRPGSPSARSTRSSAILRAGQSRQRGVERQHFIGGPHASTFLRVA